MSERKAPLTGHSELPSVTRYGVANYTFLFTKESIIRFVYSKIVFDFVFTRSYIFDIHVQFIQRTVFSIFKKNLCYLYDLYEIEITGRVIINKVDMYIGMIL